MQMRQPVEPPLMCDRPKRTKAARRAKRQKGGRLSPQIDHRLHIVDFGLSLLSLSYPLTHQRRGRCDGERRREECWARPALDALAAHRERSAHAEPVPLVHY
eukprot:scaffold12296_cov27-Tisochrysis_lutea.AAC.8